MKVGILGRNDFWNRTFTEHDYRVIREAKIELIKIFEYTDLAVFQRLHDENPHLEFMVRLYDPEGPGAPDDFVRRHAQEISELRPFADSFEILNEPNFPGEGWGPDAEQAKIFNRWYLEVLDRLRTLFPWAVFGFPGLSPTLLPGEDFTDLQWLEVCRQSVEGSDWLGCHCYWSDLAGMLHQGYGLRFTQYHRLFPAKPIHITEFNNDLGRIDDWNRALQYESYYKALGDYAYLASASAFILSSPDSYWDRLCWWDAKTSESRPVVWKVGGIPRPIGSPHPGPTYAVRYVSHNTPRQMTAGETRTVSFTIENAGRKTWPAEGYNKVRLGYHWHNRDGSLLSSGLWADLRTGLPYDLRSGEQVNLLAEVGAPRLEGNFVLKWDMVEEMVTWFAWQEAPTLDIEVQVGAGITPEVPGPLLVSASHNNVTSGPDNLLYAIDGKAHTRWSTFTPQRPGMWFAIDLSRVQTVAQVKLSNGGSPEDYPRGYVVKVSPDSQRWETVAVKERNDGPLAATFAPRQIRYVRIEQTVSDPYYWWSIHEVYVSAKSDLTVSASHNDVHSGPDNLLQAIDGNAYTRWSSQEAQKPGMWFAIDLGNLQNVSYLQLDNDRSPEDYPRGYVVKVSQDGHNWEIVAQKATNDRPLVVSFAPRPVRYLRIEQTGSDQFYWWSIHGVQVK